MGCQNLLESASKADIYTQKTLIPLVNSLPHTLRSLEQRTLSLSLVRLI